MNTVDHKCISCGAALDYNVSTQTWICKYCKKEYRLEDLDENIKKFDSAPVYNFQIYECNNCGAKAITNESTSSTTCVYCGNSLIIKKRLIGEYKPDYIIPFRNTKEQALEIFLKKLKRYDLSDRHFSDEKNIKKINCLYVPYWLVSCDVMASVKAMMTVENDNGVKCKLYSGLGGMKLNRIPADAKRNLSDELLQGIEPFNYDELKPFEYPYLAGMFAECYDEGKDEIRKNQIKERVEEAAVDKLFKSISKNRSNFVLQSKSVFSNEYKFEYVLVPVWFITLDYKGKTYELCLNDQTRKISGIKQLNTTKVVALRFICSIIVILLSAYLKYNVSEDFSLIFLIIFLMLVNYVISRKTLQYTKLNQGKKSVDYVEQGTFVLMDIKKEDSY